MTKVIRLIELAAGVTTSLDGKYIVEYDPSRMGTSPDGVNMIAHIVVTGDRQQAKEFETAAAAFEYWRQSHGIRADGEPNRPLTAYTVEFE